MYGLTEDSEIYNDRNILASIGDMTEEDYIYINYILPRNEIIVFQYNPKDLDGVTVDASKYEKEKFITIPCNEFGTDIKKVLGLELQEW